MSRFILALLLLFACSRAMHAAPDGAFAVTMEVREGGDRAALVFYVQWRRPSQFVVCDGAPAYRLGVRILQPHRNPAAFEMHFHIPSAPNWVRWGASVGQFWRSLTDRRRWSVPLLRAGEALR